MPDSNAPDDPLEELYRKAAENTLPTADGSAPSDDARSELRKRLAQKGLVDEAAAKADWVPYTGPQGGSGWKNLETGEKVYEDDAPGPSLDEGELRNEAATQLVEMDAISGDDMRAFAEDQDISISEDDSELEAAQAIADEAPVNVLANALGGQDPTQVAETVHGPGVATDDVGDIYQTADNAGVDAEEVTDSLESLAEENGLNTDNDYEVADWYANNPEMRQEALERAIPTPDDGEEPEGEGGEPDETGGEGAGDEGESVDQLMEESKSFIESQREGNANSPPGGSGGLREKASSAFRQRLEERGVVEKQGGDWVPYQGPQGGSGWRNVETGDVDYSDDPPGDTMDFGELTEEDLADMDDEELGGMLAAAAAESGDPEEFQQDLEDELGLEPNDDVVAAVEAVRENPGAIAEAMGEGGGADSMSREEIGDAIGGVPGVGADTRDLSVNLAAAAEESGGLDRETVEQEADALGLDDETTEEVVDALGVGGDDGEGDGEEAAGGGESVRGMSSPEGLPDPDPDGGMWGGDWDGDDLSDAVEGAGSYGELDNAIGGIVGDDAMNSYTDDVMDRAGVIDPMALLDGGPAVQDAAQEVADEYVEEYTGGEGGGGGEPADSTEGGEGTVDPDAGQAAFDAIDSLGGPGEGSKEQAKDAIQAIGERGEPLSEDNIREALDGVRMSPSDKDEVVEAAMNAGEGGGGGPEDQAAEFIEKQRGLDPDTGKPVSEKAVEEFRDRVGE